jgi:hypothetical protein
MRKVDITGIHRILTRYYGSRNVTINTNVSEKTFLFPSDIKLIFDYDQSYDIDFILLMRRINRYIIGADFFLNVQEKEKKIQINVMVFDEPEYKDFDFEFSSN